MKQRLSVTLNITVEAMRLICAGKELGLEYYSKTVKDLGLVDKQQFHIVKKVPPQGNSRPPPTPALDTASPEVSFFLFSSSPLSLAFRSSCSPLPGNIGPPPVSDHITEIF